LGDGGGFNSIFNGWRIILGHQRDAKRNAFYYILQIDKIPVCCSNQRALTRGSVLLPAVDGNGICEWMEWLGMGRPVAGREEKRSLRVEMSAFDFELLEQAAAVFGVGKSDLVRRLVRASVGVGPALSTESIARIEDLASQVRIVGRNLMQVLKAIHRGEAVGIAESEPVWRGLHELIAALDAELSAFSEATIRQSAALRERAGLQSAGSAGLETMVAAE
jgi:hypothetical protein